MENTANRVTLRGRLTEYPAFSHENHGRRFYRFPIEVPRLSGASDTLRVLAPEELLPEELGPGDTAEVTGQVRSFNNRRGPGRRLVISVLAGAVRPCGEEPENTVDLTGAICREPVFRRTPLGREICDIMLAVSRPYLRTDYLPCILWGRMARAAARLGVGTRLHLTGRLQSREYIKILDTGSERRTAYEISANSAECAPDVP